MDLPPLPALDACRDELISSYRGPTKRSNWVVPGMLICGDRSSLDSEKGLQSILDVGVTTFVCLQSRQETNASVDYKKRASASRPNSKFLEQPIPDQEVTDDALIEDLVTRLLDRLQQGEVCYVHCRGGHGRTGTVCSVLLGRLYDIDAAEVMARVQLYHDVRQQPIFCADGYEALPDGSGCVILFPSQRSQVIRLLSSGEPSSPVELSRAQSSVYGAGASKYSEEIMVQWQTAAKAASEILNANKLTNKLSESERTSNLQEALDLFWKAAKLRPDFARGYIGLSMVLRLLGELDEARDALLQGLDRCSEDGALLQALKKIEELRAADQPTEPMPTHSLANATSGYPNDNASDGNANPGSNSSTLPSDWRPRIQKPRLLMLVGLPGSGKSTFAEQLVQSGRGWMRVCQDELTGRDEFENAIGRIAKDTSKCLVLDRTNVKKLDRKTFLGLAFQPKDAVCVHFEVSADECEKRVANRTDHPTIKYGGGKNAVRSMRNDFEMPSCEEGFEEVITLRTFSDADHLLQCWGAQPPQVAPTGFFKFPTTPHVLDLTDGKALTESDRLLTPAEAAQFFDGKTTVIAEEKIDGANLGISLTENYEPQFQNRSHYVSSGYATQWKALDAWWSDNGWAICQLLEPEVEVLFGEWVWARHSVHYNRLPAYFVAFDIYNKREGRFVSAMVRDQRLEGLGIPVVPRLTERIFSSRGELEEFLNTTSAYGEGPLEGIYLRIDDPLEEGGLWHRRRGKIVRADFIQVIEDGGHWIQRDVERNQISYD